MTLQPPPSHAFVSEAGIARSDAGTAATRGRRRAPTHASQTRQRQGAPAGLDQRAASGAPAGRSPSHSSRSRRALWSLRRRTIAVAPASTARLVRRRKVVLDPALRGSASGLAVAPAASSAARARHGPAGSRAGDRRRRPSIGVGQVPASMCTLGAGLNRDRGPASRGCRAMKAARPANGGCDAALAQLPPVERRSSERPARRACARRSAPGGPGRRRPRP